MAVYQRTSHEGFTMSELARLAVPIGIKLNAASARTQVDPVFTGRLLAHEVQPGLIATASDVTYLKDHVLSSSSEPSLMFGVLLKGEQEILDVEGYGRITRELEQPSLLGFSERTNFKLQGLCNQHIAAAGFLIRPSFFDRFGENISDDGLAGLKSFVEAGVRYEKISRSPRLLELSRSLLAHPYRGQLGQLFLESNALSLVVEVAEQLNQERRIIELVGRRHYDRVVEARDILDANLKNPPKTLDLARRVGVNLTTLQSSFKTVLGVTIFGYVRTQRLMTARILLRDHNLSVAEAGYRVGFASPAAFTASYRRNFGYPPGAEIRMAR